MRIQQDRPLLTVPDFRGLNTDAFTRLRVSNPAYVFDTQLTYDLQPLIFEAITATGGGGTATVAHDATNRCGLMTFASALTGCSAYMQTYEYFRYQPGRSQQIFITFNFMEPKLNVLKFAGYSDGVNGFEVQLDSNTPKFVIYSSTSHGSETVFQWEWNLDKLNGEGNGENVNSEQFKANPSGIKLDLTKTQILVIDLQALYVGRVRMGFDIGGGVIWCHEFNHANEETYGYIATANLPIRCGMTGTGTVSTTMCYYCCSVVSEGGQEAVGGYNFSIEGTVTAASGARTHVLSLRPKTTFNSITNRTKFVLNSISIQAGANAVEWEICLGDVITGTTTFIDANATYSATQYNILGTTSGAPAIVIAAGYVSVAGTGSNTGGSGGSDIDFRYPISLNQAGAVRSLGTMTILLTGIGGTSACRVSANWRELR